MARNRTRAYRNIVCGLVLPVALSACLMEDPLGQPESDNPLPPTGINNAPEIWGNAPIAVQVGVAYSFTPQSTDPDGDPLTYSIQNRPGWASFSTVTGELSGTPQASEIGIHGAVAISVSDSDLSSSLTPLRPRPRFSVHTLQDVTGTVHAY